MLTPDQVKPLLLHEDRNVRLRAAEYFYDSGTRDTEVLTKCLQGILQFGQSLPGYCLTYHLEKLPADASAPPLLVKVLEKFDPPFMVRMINDTIGHLPLPLWDAHCVQLLAAPNFRENVHERIERRREISMWTGERLFDALKTYSEESHELAQTNLDHNYLTDLLEGLASKEYPAPTELRRMIAREVDWNLWLHSFLVRLAGMRGERALVPLFVDFLEEDSYEVLQDAAENALGMMGDPLAVNLIRARYLKWTWISKIYGVGVLGCINDQCAEVAILDLLRWNADVEERAHLALALGKKFSRQGIQIIQRILREPMPAKPFIIPDLEETLLCLSQALNVEIPEKNRLIQRRMEQDRRIEKPEKEERFDFLPSPLLDHDDAPWEDDEDYLDPSEITEEVLYPTDPIKAMAKPKPNDPCPCGSGKKYKKCCQNG